MNNDRTRVIIIGRNYTSRLGMIRAVGVLGYEIHVIRTVRKLPEEKKNAIDIDGYSKYVTGYHFALEPDRDNLVSVIKSLVPASGKAIIIPVDDYAASTIDLYLDDLKENFLFPNIGMQAGTITKLMDKDLQKNIARKSGLRVAEGWTMDVKNGSYCVPADIKYPCFPKPQISFMGNKVCMRKCMNESELRKAIDDVVSKYKNCPFVIEEYIDIEKEYATLGFSDGENVVMPGMIHLLRDGSGGHKGVTMLGRVCPYKEFENVILSFVKFIKTIHFVGLFDIDSYESSGNIYFNELNLRFGASGFSITESGVNLPCLLIDFLRKGNYDYSNNISEYHNFVNEKVVTDDYYGGYLSYKDYRHLLSDSDIYFIKSADDPQPYLLFKNKNTIVKSLKSLIKNLLHV